MRRISRRTPLSPQPADTPFVAGHTSDKIDSISISATEVAAATLSCHLDNDRVLHGYKVSIWCSTQSTHPAGKEPKQQLMQGVSLQCIR
jgi:hypothetical protein